MSTFEERYGPWAIVTGATSGTGLLFAHRLAEKGLHIVLVARREEAMRQISEELRARYGVQTRSVAVDLAHEGALERIAEAASELDVGLLVNNAGFSITGEFIGTDLSEQLEMLQTNCTAPMMLSHYFGRRMAKRGKGGILLVSSSVAYTPVPLWSTYAASKAYVLTLGEAFAYEMKNLGVDVLTVCPGAMRTGFQARANIKPTGAMDPAIVVRKAIASLGAKRTIMPGFLNRIAFKGLGRLLPGGVRLPLFAKMMAAIQKR